MNETLAYAAASNGLGAVDGTVCDVGKVNKTKMCSHSIFMLINLKLFDKKSCA